MSDGALRGRELREERAELGGLLGAEEDLRRPGVAAGVVGEQIAGNEFAAGLAEMLEALLVGDAEEPTAELGVVAQVAEVARGADKGGLDEVEAGLLVADEFEDVGIQRQLVAAKEDAPRCRRAGPGLRHGQWFRFGHAKHPRPVECGRPEKVQRKAWNADF